MKSVNDLRSWLRVAGWMLAPGLLLPSVCRGQKAPYVPLISGGIGIFSSTNQGFTFVQPVAAPVLEFPIGQHVLVESRADLRGLVQQSGPNGSFEGSYTSTLEYLQ